MVQSMSFKKQGLGRTDMIVSGIISVFITQRYFIYG